ncbi:hypothetical protein JCM19992_08820 [Thermostilla marina]
MPETNSPTAPAWQQSRFMKAARGEPVDRIPVWLMRQAGRYMPEYRAIREKVSFLDLCRNPQLCAEVMITAVERLGVDAAILFADLLPILDCMGLPLRFTPGDGPILESPVRMPEDVERIRELDDLEPLSFVFEAVVATRKALNDSLPLIGFAGAPFTLAGYAVEGRGSRDFAETRRFMRTHESAWHDLMGRLSRAVSRYLVAQIEAGVQAVQLFDSWVGCLSPADYRRFVLPHTQAVFAALPKHVPAIHFGTGNPALIPLMAEAGGSIIGVDWRVDIADAWAAVGEEKGIQGNLDPTVLLGPVSEIERQAESILRRTQGRCGHIFNLGHGVLPDTPVEHAVALVDFVHAWDPHQLPD